MALLKLVLKQGVELYPVKIDKENIGQLASTLVSALTSRSTCFKLGSKEVTDALRAGTTWSNDAVIVGIQDFIILAETGAQIRKPHHVDLLREVCLSRTTLEEMDQVSLTMTIAHYTRVTLDSMHAQINKSTRMSARQLVKYLIEEAVPMVFLKGVDNV